jgi:hypothetical protein
MTSGVAIDTAVACVGLLGLQKHAGIPLQWLCKDTDRQEQWDGQHATFVTGKVLALFLDEVAAIVLKTKRPDVGTATALVAKTPSSTTIAMHVLVIGYLIAEAPLYSQEI